MLISKFDTTNICESIEEFEEKKGVIIPSQYKKFLIKYNGGETPKTDLRINNVSSDIEGFYGLGNASREFNYLFIDENLFNTFMEDDMLPIGYNSFGDYFLISLNNEAIYFFYHDKQKKYIKLSLDFMNFINNCKSKRVGHIKSIEERKAIVIKNGFENEIPELIHGWQEEIDRFSNIYQEALILD